MALSGAEKTRRYHEKRMREIAEMPKIPCECGCGTMIPPFNTNLKPARFAHGHNGAGIATRFKPGHGESVETRDKRIKRGCDHWAWRGGVNRTNNGYIRLTLSPEEAQKHPTAIHPEYRGSWTIARSHYVWNLHHPDDPVMPGEQIHHKNRVRDDDQIGNLEKMGASDHLRMHALERKHRPDGPFCA